MNLRGTPDGFTFSGTKNDGGVPLNRVVQPPARATVVFAFETDRRSMKQVIHDMKTLALLFTGIAISLAAADLVPSDAELAGYAASDAKVLGQLLSENWIVEASGNVVTLTSKFEVFHIGLYSRPFTPPLPAFSDSTPQAALLAETEPEKYVIKLRYERRLSPEELEHRIVARKKAADTLNNGTKTKEEHGEALRNYSTIKVPKYETHLYYIYEELPESPYGRFYPPKSVQKVGGAKEILAVVLDRIRTAYD